MDLFFTNWSKYRQRSNWKQHQKRRISSGPGQGSGSFLFGVNHMKGIWRALFAGNADTAYLKGIYEKSKEKKEN